MAVLQLFVLQTYKFQGRKWLKQKVWNCSSASKLNKNYIIHTRRMQKPEAKGRKCVRMRRIHTVWNLLRGILCLACMIWISLIFMFLLAQNIPTSTHCIWSIIQCCIEHTLYYFYLRVEFVADTRNYSVIFMILFGWTFTFSSPLF